MTIKVKMTPHLSHFRSEASGIATVVKKWFHYLPQFGIELVKPDAKKYDLSAVHAGMTGAECDIAHLHGIYFTNDYDAPAWEYEVNARIVQAVRNARAVTVPSNWVSETFQRDMRITPRVIGHGVDWQEWQHNEPDEGYVLAYGKNRAGTDVCDPSFIIPLASRFPYLTFVVTFAPKGAPSNVQEIGLTPHEEFKKVIQRASVVISPIKETWGVMQAESLAAGKPILGVNLGGNRELIERGVNGYLYDPGNYDDMAEGLAYCLKHRKILGENARETAKALTWEGSIEKLAEVYRLAMVEEPPTVSVIIPVYNKTPEQVRRAIQSCLSQTFQPLQVVVVRDGGDETAFNVCKEFDDHRVQYIPQNNQGVAVARNNGIAVAWDSKYITCLDADDWLEPTFLETCVRALETDRSLGIAYTRLQWHNHETGQTGVSDWPGEWDFDRQLKKQNQVPTCCTFRRVMWERLGGYRQRYAPGGAGAEDAEFWLRAGAYGWKGELVTQEALFNYSFGGSVSANKKYVEPDWLAWHPWVKDGLHPFASYATPKRQSHPVRQYDEPIVSVIIPVGPGHERELINALDSLEAQTFRKWEAVVVDDTGSMEAVPIEQSLLAAYPYIRPVKIFQPKMGAGYARNRGAELARAPFLLFLDADDTLHPQALEKMLSRWNETGMAVYTDYVGQAFIDETYALSLEQKSRLQSFNAQTGEAIIAYQAYEFDCQRAMQQPQPDDLYIWNLITTLHPKAWFDKIGGFDETMDTWEDWDYWLRLARAGHCFTRLPEQLVRYRFYTGQRRAQATPETQEGRHKAQSMIEYLRRKYGDELVGCGCKKNGTNAGISGALTVESSIAMADSEFVKARYLGPGGNHHIIGAYEFNHDPGLPSRRKGDKWVLYYGYKGRGFETLVHKEDVRLMAGKWEPLPDVVKPEVAIAAPPEPKLLRMEPPRPIVSPKEAQEKLSKAKERAKARAGAQAE
jgi:glycosyltransferase involved in cell wall biosynthesis